jgi:hypothetical protein
MAEVLLAAAALVVAAISVAALAARQLSTGEAFEEHRPSAAAVHTLPAEVSADQVPHLDSIMVVLGCLRCGRRDSLAQSVGPQGRMSASLL